MLPYLRPGTLIVAVQSYSSLDQGDVVCLRHQGLEKVKRIDQIKGDNIYVLGDNSKDSTDSRHFGWLPITTVTAKVIWPRI